MTHEDMQVTLDAMGEKALSASRALAVLGSGVKTAFLQKMAMPRRSSDWARVMMKGRL